jgi:hypothetical protein
MPLDLDALVLAPAHAAFGEANRGFAVPEYTPAGGAAFAIDGVFRLPTQDVFERLGAGGAPGMTSRKPELDLRVSQFPAGIVPAQGDQVTVRGVAYTVADVRLDGDGLATLELREA